MSTVAAGAAHSLTGSRRLLQRLALALTLCLVAAPAAAQEEPRVFAGALIGVSALSADARAVTTGAIAMVSLYDPRNGAALNLFGGVHVAQYFSVQANWIWNRNDLTLFASSTAPDGAGFYEQHRHSRQHAAVIDGLVYFRRLESRVRPYLGTGLSVARFSSEGVSVTTRGLGPPAGAIRSTPIGLRSHVGIDLRLSRRIAFRYSFSETISGNPISEALKPQGNRGLMNFQNLFGFVARY